MAVLTPQPKMQFTTAAGVPLSGGKVYTYIAGTTTPQATYTDYTGANANTNPVILDSRGEANIWLGGALYKFKLTDANDIEIWTVDYISAPTSAVSPVLSGSVTIDSSTPTPALTITQTGTGPALRVQDASDPDATPFIVDASGNVGIGTAAPAQKLDVYDGVIRVGGSVQGRLLGYSATNSNVLNLGVSVGTGSSTDVGFYNLVSGNAVFGTNNTERMRIDTNGNVGIGEDAPTSLLHLSSPTSATLQVLGDSTTSALLGRASTNATAPQITFAKSRGTQTTPTTVATSDNMGTTTYTAYDGTAFRTAAQITGVVETYTTTDNVSGFLSFLTRPTGVAASVTERMRIDSSGNVLIGTTTANGKITVQGGVTLTGQNYAYYAESGGATSTGYLSGETVSNSIWTSGRISSTEFNARSDGRLKKDVTPIPTSDAWHFVNNVKPVHYKWRNDVDDGHKFGFIAQDIVKAGFPHLVAQYPDADAKEETDADGFTSPAGVTLTVNYDQIVPVLTAALRDALAQIQELKADFAAYKATHP